MALSAGIDGIGRSRRRYVTALSWLIASVVALASLPAPTAAQTSDWAAPPTVYILEAGHTSDRLFLDTWRTHRDLLGNPITEEFEVMTGLPNASGTKQTVQYYEHVAIAYLAEQPPGEQVWALPLGKEAFNRDKVRERRDFVTKGTCEAGTADTCVLFPETGHSLRGDAKEFWEVNGGERLIGQPLTEALPLDGFIVQYFDRAVLRWKTGREISPRPLGKETAARLKLNTKRVPQPDGVPIYSEVLFIPPPAPIEVAVESSDWLDVGPGPQQGAPKEVVVSISAQSLWAYEDGQLATMSLISSGTGNVPETATPLGYYTVLTKFDVQTMEGTISDEYYLVEDVPYVMYFDNLGNALHGTYWHSNFGTPMSHGCVNLPVDIAAFLFDWAPVGTAVSVIA